MIRQFLKILLQRCFKKNVFHTILNLLGLAVGLMAFMLIMIFIQHERNYDTFHKNYHNIYRIVCDEPNGSWVGTPAQLGPFLMERVPEIEVFVRMEEKNIGMLTLNLLKWVAIAFVISCPFAWLYLNNWLENFAYHMELNAGIFLLAGLFALAVGFISVIFQAYRAAMTDPADSLRYE